MQLHKHEIRPFDTLPCDAGIVLPIIVPPIRESFSKPDVTPPPPFKELVQGAKERGKPQEQTS